MSKFNLHHSMKWTTSVMNVRFLPRAHAQEVNNRFLSVVSTKIAKSEDSGTRWSVSAIKLSEAAKNCPLSPS